MPIYLDIYNLIVAKKAVTESYSGGIPQFRIDYNIPLSEINQEDDELFSLGQMNADQFDIDHLVSSGLSFDVENQKSAFLPDPRRDRKLDLAHENVIKIMKNSKYTKTANIILESLVKPNIDDSDAGTLLDENNIL